VTTSFPTYSAFLLLPSLILLSAPFLEYNPSYLLPRLSSFLRPASLILFPTTFLDMLLPTSFSPYSTSCFPFLFPISFLSPSYLVFPLVCFLYLLVPLFRLQQSRPLQILCGTLLPKYNFPYYCFLSQVSLCFLFIPFNLFQFVFPVYFLYM
jgi:hypothetical protein